MISSSRGTRFWVLTLCLSRFGVASSELSQGTVSASQSSHAYASHNAVPSSTVNHALFRPIGSLSSLSAQAFTTFAHPLFPDYSARIKETDFCDHGVKYVAKIAAVVQYLIAQYSDLIRDILTSERVIFFSTFSKAGMIPNSTLSSCGPTEA